MACETQKSILKQLLHFANTGDMRIPVGTYTDINGNPVAVFPNHISANEAEEMRRVAKEILLNLVTCGTIVLDALLRDRKVEFGIYFPGREGAGVFIPHPSEASDIPLAILAIAATTETDAGDTLADRVRHCTECGFFFLQKTRRESSMCTDRCRWKNSLRKRKSVDA